MSFWYLSHKLQNMNCRNISRNYLPNWDFFALFFKNPPLCEYVWLCLSSTGCVRVEFKFSDSSYDLTLFCFCSRFLFVCLLLHTYTHTTYMQTQKHILLGVFICAFDFFLFLCDPLLFNTKTEIPVMDGEWAFFRRICPCLGVCLRVCVCVWVRVSFVQDCMYVWLYAAGTIMNA